MFGVNISALLDSLDTVAKETLEEPRESATRIRSKRKQAESQESLRGIASSDNVTLEVDQESRSFSDNASEEKQNITTSAPLEDGSNHSNRTQESYVIASASPNTSIHGSEELSTRERVNSSTPSSGKLSSTLSGILPKRPVGISTTAVEGAGGDQELKKLLKKKTQEIESLNQECLELEEQCTSLKQEVQEAWDHYKLAQEKAAVREAELQDELSQVQKAKQIDKQQSVAQMAKLNEDINLLIRQMQTLRDEKQEMVQQMQGEDSIHASYNERILVLENELKEARINSLQGAQSLRDEVKQLQVQNEQMRIDHTQLLRQTQAKQSQLELENAELVQALTESQKEVQRLKSSSGGGSSQTSGSMNEDYLSREVVNLQKELKEVHSELDRQKDLKQAVEVQLRQLERDHRILQMTNDEQRQRATETEQRLTLSLQLRDSQLAALQQPSGALNRLQSVSTDHADDGNSRESQTIRDLKGQVEHLSKMLLKKQSDLIDLQAERTAQKAKIADLQGRCSGLEQQLTQLRDMEEGDDDLDDGIIVSGGTTTYLRSSGSERLLQRRSKGAGSSSSISSSAALTNSNSKVISDLEKIGVKPNASVTKAVTMLDSMAMCTGRFLRTNPLLRLVFVLYLVMLHLWVFIILVIHTHSLEVPNDPRDRVQNRLNKGP